MTYLWLRDRGQQEPYCIQIADEKKHLRKEYEANAFAVAFCRVSYLDIERIEHTVEIEAATLFEAVAQAVAALEEMTGAASRPDLVASSRCPFFRQAQ